MLKCVICETAKATTLNDGDRVCAPCDAILKELIAKHPELSERDECLGCGAMECVDALCHADSAAYAEGVY
jgi:hypothetical protein